VAWGALDRNAPRDFANAEQDDAKDGRAGEANVRREPILLFLRGLR
jgi:hypothetical protein